MCWAAARISKTTRRRMMIAQCGWQGFVKPVLVRAWIVLTRWISVCLHILMVKLSIGGAKFGIKIWSILWNVFWIVLIRIRIRRRLLSLLIIIFKILSGCLANIPVWSMWLLLLMMMMLLMWLNLRLRLRDRYWSGCLLLVMLMQLLLLLLKVVKFS